MKTESKKPSLAAVVVKSGGPSPKEDDDDSYDASVGELADVLGVGPDQYDAFKAAFQAAVMSCK